MAKNKPEKLFFYDVSPPAKSVQPPAGVPTISTQPKTRQTKETIPS